MDILTKENARDGMKIVRDGGAHIRKLVRASDDSGWWFETPSGRRPIPSVSLRHWRILKTPVEPPLTAIGPESTDRTGAVDLGASSVDLKALSARMDRAVGLLGCILGNGAIGQGERGLLEETLEIITDAQLLLGGAGPREPSVDLKALSDMVADALEVVEIIHDAKGGVEDLAWVKVLAGQALPSLQKAQSLLGDKASSRMVKGERDDE